MTRPSSTLTCRSGRGADQRAGAGVHQERPVRAPLAGQQPAQRGQRGGAAGRRRRCAVEDAVDDEVGALAAADLVAQHRADDRRRTRRRRGRSRRRRCDRRVGQRGERARPAAPSRCARSRRHSSGAPSSTQAKPRSAICRYGTSASVRGPGGRSAAGCRRARSTVRHRSGAARRRGRRRRGGAGRTGPDRRRAPTVASRSCEGRHRQAPRVGAARRGGRGPARSAAAAWRAAARMSYARGVGRRVGGPPGAREHGVSVPAGGRIPGSGRPEVHVGLAGGTVSGDEHSRPRPGHLVGARAGARRPRPRPLPGGWPAAKVGRRRRRDDNGAATLDPSSYLARWSSASTSWPTAGAPGRRRAGRRLRAVALGAAARRRRRARSGPVLTWLDSRPAPPAGAPGPGRPGGVPPAHRRLVAPALLDGPAALAAGRRSARRPRGSPGWSSSCSGELLDEAPMSVSQASGTGLLDTAHAGLGRRGVRARRRRPGRAADARAARLAGAAAAGRTPGGGRRCATAALGAAGRRRRGVQHRLGLRRPSRAAVTVGTSAAVRLVQAAPAGAAAAARCRTGCGATAVDERRIVTGAAYSNGGNLFAWARRELRLPEGEALEEALEAVEPGGGVTADPRLGGDRPPGVDPRRLRGGVPDSASPPPRWRSWPGLMDGVCRLVRRRPGGDRVHRGRRSRWCSAAARSAASAWWRRAFAVGAGTAHGDLTCEDPEVGCTGAAIASALTTARAPADRSAT